MAIRSREVGERPCHLTGESQGGSVGARRAQCQAHRVDAVALVGGGAVALAFEDVAEVRPAAGTPDFDPGATRNALVGEVLHAVTSKRCIERRPSAMGFEFCRAGEKLRPARPARVDTLGGRVGELAREGSFRARLAQHVVLQVGQPLSPFRGGAGDGIPAGVGRGGSVHTGDNPATQVWIPELDATGRPAGDA